VATWRLFVWPEWRAALLVGFLSALAYLTKASLLPGLLLFSVFFGLGAAWQLYTQGRVDKYLAIASFHRRLHVLILFPLLFLTILSPYLYNSKRVFGQYFFNINSAYFMWYDSWTEAKASEVYRWRISTFSIDGFESRPNVLP
jgi:hypothetical protein